MFRIPCNKYFSQSARITFVSHTAHRFRTGFPLSFSNSEEIAPLMSRSTLLKRSIIRVYSIVTFTASVITSRRQRHGKCRPENLPFYKLSRALTTNINPLYFSGMIPGACTIRRTNKSDSGELSSRTKQRILLSHTY